MPHADTLAVPPHTGHNPREAAARPADGRSQISRFAALVAVALILYLPLEPAILSPISVPLLWVFRLLPDALVAALAAAVMWVDWNAYRTPHRVLIVMTAIAVAITVITVARGQSAVDAINAQRVLLRYPLLGLVLWRSIPDLRTLPLRLIQAIVLAGTMQVVLGVVSVIWTTLVTGSVANAYFLAGTVGRYDRYGPLLAALILAMLAWSMASGWRAWFWPLLLVAAPLLYLSTSRQAMAGLAFAAIIAALLPMVTRRIRLLSVTIAIAAATMILLTPTTFAAPSAGTGKQVIKGGTALSAEPTRNFRLYLMLAVMPWAAQQEPMIGFGPGKHDATITDPRLERFIATSGLQWSSVVPFMNDSEYASLIIQFGIPATLAFLALAIGSLAKVARAGLTSTEPLVRFSLLYGLMALLGAAAGPFFEARTESVLIWIPLLTAVGLQSSGDFARSATSSRLVT